MAMKDAILKKQIGGIIYELMVKTSTANVMIDDSTTLETKLTQMLADIKDSKDKLAALLGDDAASSITGQIQEAIQEAVDALTNEEDSTSLAGKIKAINDSVTAINDSSTGILATAKKYTDDQIGLSGTAYPTVKAYVDSVKDDINAGIAGAFHFKGTVDYVKDLPTEDVSSGDVYQVKYTGETGTTVLNAEYAYNGTEFVELGSVIDLSAYYTATQTTEAINSAKEAAIEAAATDATSKANAAKEGAIEAASSALNAYKEINDAVVAQKARFIVSATQPEDLTEADVWAQIVE